MKKSIFPTIKSTILASIFATIICFSFSSCNNNEEKLKQTISEANAQCPIYVDDVTTCTAILYENGDCVYKYEIIETEMTNIALLKEVKDEMKEQTIKNLIAKKSDSESKQFYDLLAKCKANLIYRYIGDYTNDSLEIIVSYTEIQ